MDNPHTGEDNPKIPTRSYNNPYLSRISGNLTDVLDNIGFSEKHRENRIKHGMMLQMVHLIYLAIESYCNSTCSLVMGSVIEGTTAFGMGSDQDCLMFLTTVKAFCNKENTKRTLGVVFTRDENTPAGYTKLQPACKGCVINEESDINFENNLDRAVIKFKPDSKERLIVAHFNVADRSSPGIFASISKHGPAVTLHCRSSVVSDADIVLSFLCNDITNELEEWYNRDRPHNWPSKDTRDLFKTLGCFVVPVGHPSSPDITLEWRISFSLQERHLMWQLNPTQYHCFMLLKLIKTFLIKPQFGDVLTSYHCKTLLFYTIERLDQRIWIRQNLILCLRMCLILLHEWISEKYIPNYFIPKENMFVKMDSALKDEYDNFKSYVAVICDHWDCLFSIDFNDFGKQFFEKLKGKQFRARKTESTLGIIPFNQIYSISWFSSDCSVYMNGIKNTLQYFDIVEAVLQSSRTCTRYTTFDEHIHDLYSRWFAGRTGPPDTPERVEQLIESYQYLVEDRERQPRLAAVMAYKSLFQIALGSVMAARHFQKVNKQYLQKSDTCLKRAKAFNPMASMLVKATILLKQSLFDSTNIALNAAENISKDTRFCCLCFGGTTTYDKVGVRKQQSLNVEGTVLSNTEGCLYFTRNDYDILPIALTFERYTTVDISFSFLDMLKQTYTPCGGDKIRIFVDPVMYLYYLQYLNNQHNNPGKAAVALQKMENELFNRLGRADMRGHTDTWLNVLGDIFVKKGWRRLALKCFRYSHTLMPYTIAVRWHVMFLLFSPSGGAI